MKKLKKIKGACAVLALWYLCQKDENAVLRVCQAYGFREAQGMFDHEWQQAAWQLGISMREINIEPRKLGLFIKEYPDGLYLISTRDHLFVVDNGIVFDPRYTKAPGLNRTIYYAWRIGA